MHSSSFFSKSLLEGGKLTHSQKHVSTVSFICLEGGGGGLYNMNRQLNVHLMITGHVPEGLAYLCLSSKRDSSYGRGRK
jgi:hypothetical protein